MGMDKLSRRQMVGMVGAAAALASSGVAMAAPAALARRKEKDVATPRPTAEQANRVALLAPLQAGSTLGAWTVLGILPVRAGAITVGLRGASGDTFYIDVCVREDAGPNPPARTDRCDIFVANEGNGGLPTVESHGLAAMAVAEIVRANEHSAGIDGLMTHTARLAEYGDAVFRGLD